MNSFSINASQLVRVGIAVLIASLTLPTEGRGETSTGDSDQAEIRAALVSDIQDAERLAGVEIKVAEDDGHVVLFGSANSLFDKRYASELAKQTRGVKAVINQIRVRRPQRNDSLILEDIEKVLVANSSVERSEINVTVERGYVTLAGAVDSLAEKRLAETTASNVKGVVAIDNQITIHSDSSQSDQKLRSEISGLLVHSVYLDDVDVDVQVKNQVAILTGTVGSLAQQQRAEEIAEIAGVKTVDTSGLTIAPGAGDRSIRKQRFDSADEKSIEKWFKRSLVNDPLLFNDVERIRIKAKGSMVTLTGRVTRLREKTRAEALARNVVGVTKVNNDLDVDPLDSPPSNLEIIALTQEALRRSANLERHDLRVHCQDAHVTLYGVVDSKLEKQTATWIAGGVPGVVHVNNSLAVERPASDKSDKQIQQDIQRKLKYRLLEDAKQVRVSVEDGVAILSGEVDTWRQWQAVTDLAIEAGAKHPHNLLDVRLHPPHGAPDVFVPR